MTAQPPGDPRAGALWSWFLGPRAENDEVFAELVGETVCDHVRWRTAFRPEDAPVIPAGAHSSPEFAASIAALRAELGELRGELRQGVPFFSGRYNAHMLGDQTMAAQLGYLAAMLHNPNNVSSEVSPVTTRLEAEVVGQLGRMIGYDTAAAWGHLTGGGTIANLEALWIGRNICYFPVAAALAARERGADVSIELPSGAHAPLDSLGLFELLNIRTSAVLDLLDGLRHVGGGSLLRLALEAYSFGSLGYQEYGRLLATRFHDRPGDGVVIVPATAHYSWEKIVRALGVGAKQLVFAPVDERARMDTVALWRLVRALTGNRVPIIACVSVAGSTEEGAFDPLDRVLEVRARAETELGVTFHVHSDACYGGYGAAATWRSDGQRRTAAAVRSATRSEWPTDAWVRSVVALAGADSVSIDPHKLGFVPYPAGALLVRDNRSRALVATEPPYILPSHVSEPRDDLVPGKFAFEGSRPGAAAAAVWLSHRVVPLDERGYGYLIERLAVGARHLYHALADADLAPFTVALLPEPDLNIVCFVVCPPKPFSMAELNALNEAVYARLSVQHPFDSPEYVISRTVLRSPVYRGVAEPLLQRVNPGLLAEWPAAGLVVLRAVVMNPFLADAVPGAPNVEGLVAAIGAAAARVTAAAAKPLLAERPAVP